MAENGNSNGAVDKSGNSALDGIVRAVRGARARGLPPVHLWNPPHCGDIGLKIARDGTWHYRNSPIGRMALVKLFSTILRKDADGHVLVTPVEKIVVEVEDAPFMAVELRVEHDADGQALSFRTNVDDWARAGPGHEMRFELGAADGVKPYIRVRADLWALVSRAVFYDLVEIGEIRTVEGVAMFGVVSQNVFFPMAPASDLDSGV